MVKEKYTLKVQPGTWTSRKKYIIKEGRKEILKFNNEQEANEVLNYLNSLKKTRKRKLKPTTTDDGKHEQKK